MSSSSMHPTAVNDAVVDSVTRSNTKVLSDAPAMAMGNLSQAINNALTMAALQTQRAQQGADHALQAASQIAYSKLFNENN